MYSDEYLNNSMHLLITSENMYSITKLFKSNVNTKKQFNIRILLFYTPFIKHDSKSVKSLTQGQ